MVRHWKLSEKNLAGIRLFDLARGGFAPKVRQAWNSKNQTTFDAISFSPNGSTVLLSGKLRECLPDGRAVDDTLREIPTPFAGRRLIQNWSPSGDLVALAWEEDGRFSVRLVSPHENDRYGRPKVVTMYEPSSRQSVVGLSPSGRELLCAGYDGVVRIFGSAEDFA